MPYMPLAKAYGANTGLAKRTELACRRPSLGQALSKPKACLPNKVAQAVTTLWSNMPFRRETSARAACNPRAGR